MHREDTALLPGFPQRFGRPRVSHIERLRRDVVENSRRRLEDLQALFLPWLDVSLLAAETAGVNSRNRVFSFEWLFWAFLCQTLAGLGCRGAVKRVQSWAIDRSLPVPSSNPSAYCQARNRLPVALLHRIFADTAARLAKRVSKGELWHGRRVKLIDGTGLSAADTECNQAEWPQSSNMKPGCGFPELKLVGLFCLHSGALLGWEEGNKHQHELRLWRRLWSMLCPRDVVLGDRAFGTYACIAALLRKGVDGVYRLHGARKMDWRKGRRLGRRDRLCVWTKPRYPSKGWTTKQWQELPDRLEVRVVEASIDVPGFRTKKVTLVSTLTESSEFPAEELVALYRKRWSVEVFFRDVKITLGMDVLKCQSPTAVRRELAMYLICHNLLRGVIQEAARQEGVPVERISFKGAVEQLCQWLWLFMGNRHTPAERRKRLREFYAALATAPVPDRPDRAEPRVRKRRPKNFRLMTRIRNAEKPRRTA
jgi:hypothetical protein